MIDRGAPTHAQIGRQAWGGLKWTMPVRPSSDAEAEIVGLGTARRHADVVSVTIIVMMRDILVRVRWHLIDVTGGMDRELNARDASPRQIGGMGHAGEAGQDQHQACQERQKGSH